MGVAYDKAVLLYRQERYKLAGEELARDLVVEPNSARAHAMLALCLAAQAQYVEGRRAAERAVALAPQLAFAHYALAWVVFRDSKYTCRRGVIVAINAAHLHQLRLKKAEDAVREAIRLSPGDAHLFGLLALIRFDSGDPRECLKAAQHGLAMDPQQGNCLRAQALGIRALGDSASATAASAHAIAANPEGASNHVIHGRTLLLGGRYELALEHFAEAMRLDPNSPYAREGFLEGLRARRRLYRWLLRLGLGYTRRKSGLWLGLWLSLLLFLLVWLPMLATIIVTLRYHLPNPIREPLVGISVIPGLCLFAGKYWVTFALQFDPVARPVLPPSSRRRATALVLCYLGAMLMFAWDALMALEMRRAATALLCSAGALLALLIIRLMVAGRADAARYGLGHSIESQPR